MGNAVMGALARISAALEQAHVPLIWVEKLSVQAELREIWEHAFPGEEPPFSSH